MTQNERIRAVRKKVGLTIVEFGDRLGVSNSAISMIENGKNNASNQTITQICQTFGVNEHWLRTGEGEMMAPRTDDERITEFLDDVLANKPDIRRRLISALARLNPEDWDLIEKMIDKIAGDEKEAAPE